MSLVPALSRLLDKAGEGSLQVNLSVTDSQEVLDLRDQITQLHAEIAQLKERNRSLEYDYRCEVVINMELVDLCRNNGIKIRRPLVGRHRDD